MALRLCLGLLSVHLAFSVVTDDAAFRLHFNRVMEFQCSQPRPVSMPAMSLVTGVDAAARIYTPHVTVLHRCDAGAGCCPNPAASCGVIDSLLVNLTFRVTHAVSVPGYTKGSTSYLTVQAVNHTRCQCEFVQPRR